MFFCIILNAETFDFILRATSKFFYCRYWTWTMTHLCTILQVSVCVFYCCIAEVKRSDAISPLPHLCLQGMHRDKSPINFSTSVFMKGRSRVDSIVTKLWAERSAFWIRAGANDFWNLTNFLFEKSFILWKNLWLLMLNLCYVNDVVYIIIICTLYLYDTSD